MIFVSGMKLGLEGLDGSNEAEIIRLRARLTASLKLKEHDILSLRIAKRSIDARHGRVALNFSLACSLAAGAEAEQSLVNNLSGRKGVPPLRYVEDERTQERPQLNCELAPVVVGAGCAGLFCALELAEAGLSPVVIERGDNATRRSAVVQAFVKGGELDPQSNIQFGLGGAGTFSDGKLSTGTKSSSHKDILRSLVAAGAPEKILYDAKPHIGSDLLPQIVEAIAERITQLGGKFMFRTQLIGFELADGRLQGVRVCDAQGHEQLLATETCVLACGHSARDVFELLQQHHIALERKTFAVGYRIEHLQAAIDKTQYGSRAGHPALGAAPYSLATHLGSGRSVFSFCMCPGGYVVAAASEPEGVVTNGMSEHTRDGLNANAGLLSNIEPDDIPGDDPLAGIELQRAWEQAAYARGGGNFVAPAQLVGDFIAGTSSSSAGAIAPSYPRGVSWGSVTGLLPEHVEQSIKQAIPMLAHKLAGFDTADAVLTGVETRSSSPVRVLRGKDLQSLSCKGLYPAGEGAGYAGGIMSAATDGIRVGRAICAALAERQDTRS